MYKADRRNPDLFYNGQPASLVLGQPDFTSNRAPNPPTASSLSYPLGITFDASNLWVCDNYNHRVLMYKADWTNQDLFYNGQPASLVLGQQEFASNFSPPVEGTNGAPTSGPLTANMTQYPYGVTFDADRNLWVGGWGRVLRFSFPTFAYQSASLVIGKPDFVTPDTNDHHLTDQRSLWNPSSMIFDKSGNLWVCDPITPRITMYEVDLSLPDYFQNDQPASIVLGQPDFTTANVPDPATANALGTPQTIAFDHEGNLWCADACYSRVIRYSPPFSNGQPASLVLGQPDFNSPSYCPVSGPHA
jgi:hypothetical protein